MGERICKSEVEAVISHEPLAFELGKEEVVGSHPAKLEGQAFTEDFLDPRHPLYGSVDEHGRRLPGWLEQVTVRYARALPASKLSSFARS